MNANELRIGNFIFDVEKNLDVEINSINLQSIIEYCEDECRFLPIPLTEEWLIKYKQIKVSPLLSYKKAYYFEILGIRIYIVLDGISKGKHAIDWNKDLSKIIKYVHQLQNFFYALTDEELISNKLT